MDAPNYGNLVTLLATLDEDRQVQAARADRAVVAALGKEYGRLIVN